MRARPAGDRAALEVPLPWGAELRAGGTAPVHTPFPARRGEAEGIYLEDHLISQLTGFSSKRPALMGSAWTPQATLQGAWALLLTPHLCRGTCLRGAVCLYAVSVICQHCLL